MINSKYEIGYDKNGYRCVVDSKGNFVTHQPNNLSITELLQRLNNGEKVYFDARNQGMQNCPLAQVDTTEPEEIEPRYKWPMYDAMFKRWLYVLDDTVCCDEFEKAYFTVYPHPEGDLSYKSELGNKYGIGYDMDGHRCISDGKRNIHVPDYLSHAEVLDIIDQNAFNFTSNDFEIGYDKNGRQCVIDSDGMFVTHIPNNLSSTEVLERLSDGEDIYFDARNQGMQNCPLAQVDIDEPVELAPNHEWPVYSAWNNRGNYAQDDNTTFESFKEAYFIVHPPLELLYGQKETSPAQLQKLHLPPR